MDDFNVSSGRRKSDNESHCMVCLPSIESPDCKPLSLSTSWNGWGCNRPKRPLSAFPNGFHKIKSKKPFLTPSNSSTAEGNLSQRRNNFFREERSGARLTRSVSIPNGLMCNEVERENERKTVEPLSPLEKSPKAKFMIGDTEEAQSDKKLKNTVTAGMILKVQPGKYVEDIINPGDHFPPKPGNDRSIFHPEATRGNMLQSLSLPMRNNDPNLRSGGSTSMRRIKRMSCPSLEVEHDFDKHLRDGDKGSAANLTRPRRRLSEICPPTGIVLPRASSAIKCLSDLKDGLPREDAVLSHEGLTNRIESWLDGVDKPTLADEEYENLASEVSLIRL